MAEISDASPRRYRSALREEQAGRTRTLIARAARTRFVEGGWAGTSVRSVAGLAGVSEATVYAVYGSKAGLATSLLDAADADADVERAITEIRAAEGDPTGQLRAFVDYDRRLFERAGDVLRVLVEGKRHEPALASAYAEGRGRGDSNRRRVFESWPTRAFARGVDVQTALDVYSFTCSIEAFDHAVLERGWAPERVEEWWHRTLAAQLLKAR